MCGAELDANPSTSARCAGAGPGPLSRYPQSLSRTRAACLLLLALFPAACSPATGDAESGEPISCALAGSNSFKPDCRLERTTINAHPVFVVRHPDGGFRRLQVSTDGQHLEAADGADVTQSALKGDRFEVILGGDKYVIPVKADAR